jgi:hypothetical protein
MEYTSVPNGIALTKKVKINRNMFDVLVLNEGGGGVDGTTIIVVD